jgi:uncharacterized membrane protein YkoI
MMPARRTVFLVLFVVFVINTSTRGKTNGDPADVLPDAAARAVRRAFPGARVARVGREREHGVMLYEVALQEYGTEFELEVTGDGVIGEIERDMGLGELPKGVADRVRRVTRDGKIRHIERHERRAAFSSGRALPLHRPKVTYEITYYRAGRRRYAVVESNELEGSIPLPDSVLKVLQQRFPDATIGEVEREHALGIALFEVALETGKVELEAVISAGGLLVEVESNVDRDKVPSTVTAALKNLGEEAEPREIQKVDIHAMARLETLETPQTIYEVEWELNDGTSVEVRIAGDGTVLAKEEEKNDDTEED